MTLEKLLCPQCGGNDLEPFGTDAYKCRFCGAVLKEEHEEKKEPETHYVAPPSTDFSNRRTSYADDDDSDDEYNNKAVLKFVGIIVLAVAGIIAVFIGRSGNPVPDPSPNITIPEMPLPSPDSFINALKKETEEINKKYETYYTAQGITADTAALLVSGKFAGNETVPPGKKCVIRISNPSGFAVTNGKVSVQWSLVVHDENGNVTFEKDDYNSAASAEGEDAKRYAAKADIPFAVSKAYGFAGPGYYFIDYKLLDHTNGNSFSGHIPFDVAK
ncbi:MAG TPA: hypothetical protein VFU15_10155 [Bacteroidia bacterium]|nr:hypothetical protein [Bacteroidia bacterium]